MTALTATPAWTALTSHHGEIKQAHLRKLFADDPGRAERFSAEGAGLFLDYSKNRITDETIRLLLQLADERGVAKRREAMFAGEKINTTERRAVLHVALRAPRGSRIEVDGADVVRRRPQGAGRDGGLRHQDTQRRIHRSHRQAYPHRCEHRHRRVLSGTGDGLPRAAPIQRSLDDLPLRRQRRWC